MTKVKVHKSIGLNIDALQFADLGDPNATYQPGSTKFVVSYGGGDRDEFQGTGFQYSQNGIPISGRITSYKHVENGVTFVQVKDTSVPISIIAQAALNPTKQNVALVLDALFGGADVFQGGDQRDVFHGFGGKDKLKGNGGRDLLEGGTGNDDLRGGDGDDTLRGGKDKDNLEGHHGHDTMSGDADDDVLLGAEGNDVLDGGGGNDDLAGGAGNDRIDGGSGKDTMHGNAGDDTLKGGNGNDRIYGATGDDRITGGGGADWMDGGGGADVFVYKKASESKIDSSARDTIVNFAKSADRIDLSAVDADTTISGKQSFDFVGSSAFSGTAGELRFARQSDGTFVYGDRDGDGDADFAVFLQKPGGIILEDGNFIL